MLRLAELRKEKNLTQRQLAGILNVSSGNVAAWEVERIQPNIETLCKLANIFECTVDYLIGRENDYGVVTIAGQQLSEHEKNILLWWNKLNDDGKLVVLGYIAKTLSNPQFAS